MKVAFWSEEGGCGTTSSMAAVASVCSNMWDIKTVLLQSRNQKGDLCRKFQPEPQSAGQNDLCERRQQARGQKVSCRKPETGMPGVSRQDAYCEKEKSLCYMRDGTGSFYRVKPAEGLVTVRQGRMYYILQEEYRKQERYSKFFMESMWRLIHQAEQFSDIVFIDCGYGEDELAQNILLKSDVAVVNITQKRQNLDHYFQKRHVFSDHVIYLVNQYHQESAYNRQNLNRLYRIQKEELSLIPDNQFFRYASDNGKAERFVRRHMHCMNRDRQFYFMQELIHAANMILNTAGFVKSGK